MLSSTLSLSSDSLSFKGFLSGFFEVVHTIWGFLFVIF